MLVTITLLIAGLFSLIFGAELFVKGASSVAERLGISPLLIGLTVVAFGTSLPEISITILSGVRNVESLALGNIVGSNIANLLLIGGSAALVGELTMSQTASRFHAPTMLGVTGLLYLLSTSGSLGRLHGIFLLLSFLIYLLVTGIMEGPQNNRITTTPAKSASDRSYRAVLAHSSLVVVGLILLLIGSDWLVQAAIELARSFGLSELMIGLTIVALGTSLPELATSIIATARGQQSLALGNIIGSNITNILLVLGIAATSSPRVTVDESLLSWDIPLLLLTTCLSYLIFRAQPNIRRTTGGLLIGMYLLYIAHNILSSLQHPLERLTGWALVALMLVLSLFFAIRIRVRAFTDSSRL
jgi:cation:H+ antiporter